MTTHSWHDVRREWPVLTAYQRFEVFVAFLLTLLIAAVILVALYRLAVSVVDTLVLRTLNPLDHVVFQQVFGEIMTLLIALEFNHTLHYVIAGARGLIHTRMVVLIALLALARKVIVVDLFAAPASSVLALSALTVALAITYRMIGERDESSIPAE